MMIDQDKPISPEWLESKGFARVTNDSIPIWENFPDMSGVLYSDEDLCYLEKKIDRKQFCIVLTPMPHYYDFTVYIMENIGCGFIPIPNQYAEMTEYHFSLLYESIRREKL